MYKRQIKEAQEEGKKGAEISFTNASAVEKVHHDLFEKALANPKDFPVQDYYICNACGYTAEGEAPDVCPVCGAVKKGFFKAGQGMLVSGF